MAHPAPQATLERRIRVRIDLKALDGDVGDIAETTRFVSSILLLTKLCDALLVRVSLMAGSRVGEGIFSEAHPYSPGCVEGNSPKLNFVLTEF